MGALPPFDKISAIPLGKDGVIGTNLPAAWSKLQETACTSEVSEDVHFFCGVSGGPIELGPMPGPSDKLQRHLECIRFD
jgi:hypothetical protein